MNKKSIVIVGAVRTPTGVFNGQLSRLSAPELGAVAIRGLLGMTKADPACVNGVAMGCVLSAGVGQAPARQAAIKAGLPVSVPATTINKVCGSGMETILIGSLCLETEALDVVVAGGMESMSNAPLLLRRAKKGQPAETEPFADHLFLDGLEDAYQKKTPMGIFAEATAAKYGFSREDQDRFAIRSLERAQEASKNGAFDREIVPLTVQTPNGISELQTDENLGRATVEKILHLKPVFQEKGTITAASASGIADGAAAILMMRAETANHLGLGVRARIVAGASHSQEPKWFTLAPLEAIRKTLKSANWTVDEVDLFEINEAFAVVPMAAAKELSIPLEKINIHGGACAIGHPIGASGARIVVTLLNALERTGKKKGIAAICIGGGEALAIAVEAAISS
ncbi:MAG: acetyl-CoA acetyltransferase [Alphaproteobacteria bacterium RIFCSPHIGHO2_01_FULL_41_14]|nr:MAG: acetyl-CoA acetyltransferase [Alphaproteobacteria bacterium GWA1_45_9]OFW89805.1 MAG: acetyl-CoA acetyltransferase [Alphaproteobacteria bacterium RIFCSPHIGHO2_01_FULL_41_14]HCI48936.1 acetyl-CoA C-acetyltransferase [Holosporales bacterium]